MANYPQPAPDPIEVLDFEIAKSQLWDRAEEVLLSPNTTADVVWADIGMVAVASGRRAEAGNLGDRPISVTSNVEPDGQRRLWINLTMTGKVTNVTLTGRDRDSITAVSGVEGFSTSAHIVFCRHIANIVGLANFSRDESELAMLQLREEYARQGRTELDPDTIFDQYPALVALRAFYRHLRAKRDEGDEGEDVRVYLSD
jgi:hypothetical protein